MPFKLLYNLALVLSQADKVGLELSAFDGAYLFLFDWRHFEGLEVSERFAPDSEVADPVPQID